ncbi:MAG: biotin/lipoyl-containing protein [Thermoplasmata archaeon]
MRLSIVRDGKTEEVEVDLQAQTVRVGGRSYPFTVVKDGPTKTELEIAAEKVVVEGWPVGSAEPPGPVDVNGERTHLAELRRESAPVAHASLPRSTVGTPPAPARAADGPGVAIVPPMPGKVVEVRVVDGQSVAKGDVLVVVEAMKMRNEVASPVAGTVRSLSVKAGTNVRSREAMLRIVER